MKNNTFRSILAPWLQEFVDLKKGLGYKFTGQENTLLAFDRFVINHDHSFCGLTKEITDKWAERRDNKSPLTIYGLVLIVKQFSEFLRSRGLKTYIPVLPKHPQVNFIPHIYTPDEINAIFTASDNLRFRIRNMSACLLIIPCLIRLLYGSGIRIGEALALSNKDVDLNGKCLTLKDTKNGMERLIPLSDSLINVCKEYVHHRNTLPIANLNQESRPFFISLNGRPCNHSAVSNYFRRILLQAGIPFKGNNKGPRIHDLRHSFACHSFLKLSDEGVDLYCAWPYLSTYLGHRSLGSTEQYIRLTAQMYPALLKDTENLYIDILPNLTPKTNPQP